MAVVGSPVDGGEAVLVGGGGGASALQQQLHHVHVATGRGEVDGTAPLVVPTERRGEERRGEERRGEERRGEERRGEERRGEERRGEERRGEKGGRGRVTYEVPANYLYDGF